VSDVLRITSRHGGVRFAVHVQPRASRNELAGTHGDAIKVRLSAPPADGAANEALVTLLAKYFAVPARSVRIISGARSRAKVVEVDGIAVDDVRRLLAKPGDD
jgi:uncharacterized protein (TIGR00251 family)